MDVAPGHTHGDMEAVPTSQNCFGYGTIADSWLYPGNLGSLLHVNGYVADNTKLCVGRRTSAACPGTPKDKVILLGY